MARVGIVYDEKYLEHSTGAHSERKERLVAIMDYLKEKKILSNLRSLKPRPAPLDALRKVHSDDYINYAKNRCAAGGGLLDAGDTVVSRQSYDFARLAAGGVLTAADAVMEGEVKSAFCAVRPPGHHAEKNQAMGFCIFNNVAVAARYIQGKYSVKKILIVDWDVHHGNGTQNAFYDDDTVFYFSIHQYPYYPGTGAASETGSEKGAGFTFNSPQPAGSGDEKYLDVFKNEFFHKAIDFDPDFVLISAGFDGHRDDPLADMSLTEKGFSSMTEIVKTIANECCTGRIISVLEGGYNLYSLRDSVLSHLLVLI